MSATCIDAPVLRVQGPQAGCCGLTPADLMDGVLQIFGDNKLAIRYQNEAKDGGTSRFNKFVERS